MPTKTKVKHRVTFAPDTKNETEQLNCLVRAIEVNGPGIDELSNMIQNFHIGYSSTNNKRKPSFDSSSIIKQLRSTLDMMLDSELNEVAIRSNASDNGSIKSDSVVNASLAPIEENIEKSFKANHDSGISDINIDIEKIKNNEISPQARRRVSGLINKLDTCITELQRVNDTIEEETPSEVLESISEEPSKETKSKEGKQVNLSIDTSVNIKNVNNVNNYDVKNHSIYSSPTNESFNKYTFGENYGEENNYSIYQQNGNNDYLYDDAFDYTMNTEEVSRFDLIRQGIFAIPNQPTVIEACYSGFLLSSILTVIADDCSVLYFGILTESNLYFYNSTDDNEPMFGRIIIDQNTKVLLISNNDDNQGYVLEINGVYVLPDNQVINSKVRIKFNSKQERNIWYKVIKTTVNDWKIKTTYNTQNPVDANGSKRRLSFLSSIQLQPLYLSNTPKRTDSLTRNQRIPTKKSSQTSESTLISPDSAETLTTSSNNDSSSPTSATTIASYSSEENYGGINPSQSILSALHVLEALERKRKNQELKK